METNKINFVDRLKIKIGDKVEFKLGDKTYTDTVMYVMGHVVEGKNYDLTYVKFNKIDEP